MIFITGKSFAEEMGLPAVVDNAVVETVANEADSVEESSNPAIWIVVAVAAVAVIGFIATKTLRTNKVTDKK